MPTETCSHAATTGILIPACAVFLALLVVFDSLRKRRNLKSPAEAELPPEDVANPEQPEVKRPGGDDLVIALCCFRETLEELSHAISTANPQDSFSLRLMVFVDGLQHLSCAKVAASLDPGQDAKNDDALSTLRALASLLPLSEPKIVHCCTVFSGYTKHGVPFEVYVKGSACKASKRESHRLCLQLLENEVLPPKAVLFLDGDCRVESNGLQHMYKDLVAKKLGGCGPRIVPERVTSSCLVFQSWIFAAQQFMNWLGQSSLGMCFPLNGSCAMFSMDAIRSVQLQYLKELDPDSVMDAMAVESGEDSFMTNLVLAAGYKITLIPDAHATSFMPVTWLEYLAQQCRWKRSCLGNRTSLLFSMPTAWTGPKRIFWFPYVLAFLWTPHAGITFATTLAAKMIGMAWSEWFGGGTCAMEFGDYALYTDSLTYSVIWIMVTLYSILGAGVAVKARPLLHLIATVFHALLGFGVLIVLVVIVKVQNLWFFWVINGIFCGTLLLVQAPHGIRKPWVLCVLAFGPVVLTIECVQHSAMAVANACNSAGWGTRIGAITSETSGPTHANSRVLKRRIFLALWLATNHTVGAIFILSNTCNVLFLLIAVCGGLFSLLHLSLGIWHSGRVWSERLRRAPAPKSEMSEKPALPVLLGMKHVPQDYGDKALAGA